MRTYSIYLILFLAGILASCEDFLDQSPKYNLTLENAVTDYNGAKNIINGMYSVIAKSSNFGGDLAGREPGPFREEGRRAPVPGLIIIRITI